MDEAGHRGELRRLHPGGRGDVRHPLARLVVVVEDGARPGDGARHPVLAGGDVGANRGGEGGTAAWEQQGAVDGEREGAGIGEGLDGVADEVRVPLEGHCVGQVGAVPAVREGEEGGHALRLEAFPQAADRAVPGVVEEEADGERHRPTVARAWCHAGGMRKVAPAARVLGAVIVLVVVLGGLAACAAGPNTVAGGPDAAGFWLGLWHGLIAPVTFVISLFSETVSMYEVDNTGGWYDFGFLLGASMTLGGGGAGGAKGAKRR